MDLLKKLKTFDAYPKTLEDVRIRTTTGATVSIIAGLFMFWLFASEFIAYWRTDVRPELFVDTTRNEKLRINFEIIFPHLPCAYMSVDAMDASGEHQLGVDHNIFKTRLDKNKNPIASEKHELNSELPKVTTGSEVAVNTCGDCYGADPPAGKTCCNTCEDVQEAYRKKGWAFVPDRVEQCIKEGFTDKLKEQQNEGCKVYGFLFVNKVQGNFHIAPGKSFQSEHMHVHDLEALKFASGFNLTHKINRLSFGHDFPGIVNPLDGVEKVWEDKEGSPMYQYFVKIVPTVYEDLSGTRISTNQFSVTEHSKKLGQGHHGGLPGVFFMYDLSPIMVKFTETRQSFAHFLTSMCAIVGGVFTIAGLIDSFIYHSMRSLKKKIELGKDT